MMWKTLKHDYVLDADNLFEIAGLDVSQVNNPAYRYPDDKIKTLWKLAEETTQDQCIGIKVAQHIHPTTLHALGFAWLSSTTLLGALNRLVRYYRIVTDVEKLELAEGNDNYSLALSRTQNVEVVDADYDTFFAAILVMCQAICGESFRFTSIEMERSAPNCESEMKFFFKSPITFSSGHNVIWFDRSIIHEVLPTANAKLARKNDQIMAQYISQLDESDIAMQVKSRLIDRLSSGSVKESEIAIDLNMTLRTLQRKLVERGTSYKAIANETRRDLALEYVREQYLPLTEITYLLGYSEQANFTRAFRRWTGQSPTDYRKAV